MNQEKMKYFRMMVNRSGYAVVACTDESDAFEKIKGLSEHDFDWEDVNNGVLEDAEIVEECSDINGSVN